MRLRQSCFCGTWKKPPATLNGLIAKPASEDAGDHRPFGPPRPLFSRLAAIVVTRPIANAWVNPCVILPMSLHRVLRCGQERVRYAGQRPVTVLAQLDAARS